MVWSSVYALLCNMYLLCAFLQSKSAQYTNNHKNHRYFDILKSRSVWNLLKAPQISTELEKLFTKICLLQHIWADLKVLWSKLHTKVEHSDIRCLRCRLWVCSAVLAELTTLKKEDTLYSNCVIKNHGFWFKPVLFNMSRSKLHSAEKKCILFKQYFNRVLLCRTNTG